MTCIDGAIAGMLGVAGFQPDLQPWRQARGITLSEEAAVAGRDLRWLGLLGLHRPNITMSLFKHKKGEKAPPVHRSCHPGIQISRNFRTWLPDVKVVRTSFFVNCAAIVITSGIGLYFGLQEYKRSARNSYADQRLRSTRSKKTKKPSEQAVQLYLQKIPRRGKEGR